MRPDVSDQESGKASYPEGGQSGCHQDLRERSLKEKGGLEDKSKGNKKPCNSQLEGFNSCGHHLRAGQVCRRTSSDGIRRGEIRKHGIVEDEEGGRQ